jgi:predicted metal-dependent phosphoesterase TrpH
MNYIDLHLHSTYSDGTLTPLLLVKEAKKLGLKAVSLTDHDTTEGVSEIIAHGASCGVEILPGVELSAHIDSTSIHILGYGMRHNDSELLSQLGSIQQARDFRNLRIVSRLNDLGIAITEKDLETLSQKGQTGRPHFAQYLVAQGVVKTFDEAFDTYLGQDGSAYVPRKILPADNAIRYIRDAGGIAVLAHPLTIDHTLARIPGLIKTLTDFGLGGIEVYYPNHSKTTRRTLLELTQKYDLVATGGSDFHGHTPSGNGMGKTGKSQRLPYEILENIKRRLTS